MTAYVGSAGDQQAAYQALADQMSDKVLSSLNTMFQNEYAQNAVKEKKGEQFPVGTELAVFDLTLNGQPVHGAIRTKFLYDKVTKANVDDLIASLDIAKKKLYVLTFQQAEVKAANQSELFERCLKACDKNYKSSGRLGDSLMFKTILHYVVANTKTS